MEEYEEPLIGTKTPQNCFKTVFVAKEGSIRASIQTLTGYAIGAGIFSLPWALSQSGLVLGVIILFLGMLIYQFYYRIIIQAMEKSQKITYMSVINFYGGKIWLSIAEISILFNIIGSCSAFESIIVNFESSVITTMGFENTNFLFYLMNIIVFTMICVLSYPKTMNSLRYVTIGSTFSVFYVIIVIIFQSGSRINEIEEFSSHIEYFNFSWNSLYSISLMICAYNAVLALPILYFELENRNESRANKFIGVSMWLVMVLQTAISVLGYFSYIEKVPELIVNGDCCENINWPLVIAKAIIGITLLSNFTLSLHPLRTMTNEFFNDILKREGGDCEFYLVNYLYLLIISTIATLFPDAITYLSIEGGFVYVWLTFIIPYMLYWNIEKRKWKVVLVGLLTLVLTLLGFASTVLTAMRT